MSIFDTLLGGVTIPRFAAVRQEIRRGTLRPEGIPAALADTLARRDALAPLRPGDRVAVAVGSRGIRSLDRIVRALLEALRARGALPFIFPAMGSHGGATAEGQLDVLASYNVTSDSMGVPILSSMETRQIGVTPDGLPVHLDAHALEADWIVPVGRVKPHTDFRGPNESGLVKMLAVGCGKQFGADLCHREGFHRMAVNIRRIARVVLDSGRVLFGLAILEDGAHETYSLAAVPARTLIEEDAALLLEARSLMPSIPFEKVDLLVVSEMGKDISGTGMDPNVTGRSGTMPPAAPFPDRIAVLDLTDASHRNATGVGFADVTTRRLFDKMGFEESYPNGITSHDVDCIRLPPVMPDDRSALRLAIHTLPEADAASDPRGVWLKNTLCLHRFLITQNLVPRALQTPGLTVLRQNIEVPFDGRGSLLPGLEGYFA